MQPDPEIWRAAGCCKNHAFKHTSSFDELKAEFEAHKKSYARLNGMHKTKKYPARGWVGAHI